MAIKIQGTTIVDDNQGLRITGVSTFTNGPVFIGSGTSTGTVSQPLQVTGGAYISGNLGIGKTNPEYNLHIVGTSDPAGMFFDAYGNVAPNIAGRRANGTVSSPTGVIANDNLLVIQGGGYNGTSFADAKSVIFMQASEVWSSTAQGTHIDFATTLPGTTTRSNKLRIDGHGNILVGTSSSTGTASQRLQVTGGGYFSGNLGIGTTNPSSTLSVGGTITELYAGQYWNIVTQADVGIGASQVPLNQYLGQLAFVDTYSPSGLRRDGGGSDDVFVSSSGLIGIGTTNPTSKLDVVGDGKFTGTLSATQFTSLSDASKKINVQPIKNSIEIVEQLEGVRFDWKDNKAPSVGVIAQQVEKILPEVVETNTDGLKAVNYSGLIGVLIEAIKDQQREINILKEKLNR